MSKWSSRLFHTSEALMCGYSFLHVYFGISLFFFLFPVSLWTGSDVMWSCAAGETEEAFWLLSAARWGRKTRQEFRPAAAASPDPRSECGALQRHLQLGVPAVRPRHSVLIATGCEFNNTSVILKATIRSSLLPVIQWLTLYRCGALTRAVLTSVIHLVKYQHDAASRFVPVWVSEM